MTSSEGGSPLSGGFFDIPKKEERLKELELISQNPGFWDDAESAKGFSQERAKCESTISTFKKIDKSLADAEAALDLAIDSGDQEFIAESLSSVESVEVAIEKQEFLCKMSGQYDSHDAIIEINAGSGGTEAQDWADMLLRLYVRWAERKGFDLETLDYQAGEVAGIKSAILLCKGDYAYGHLRSEQGVHRLVRISPFDSNARRHTSFASIAVTPDIEEEIEIDIDEKDLRIDTYRSSGAGGQHVNKTDSAVRLTHLPSGIVVACQNERSQHKNKDRAMKLLKLKLYDLEKARQDQKIDEIKGARMKIDFGSQIRSYVMQPYQLVKDLRTNFETSSVDAVLDGDIDKFIEAYLLGGAKGS